MQIIDEMGYGQERNADDKFANSGSAMKTSNVGSKYLLKSKTGKLISVHKSAPEAVAARNKIGDHTTHSIIKEDLVNEVNYNEDGKKKGKIADASEKNLHVKKTPAILTTTIAKLLAK